MRHSAEYRVSPCNSVDNYVLRSTIHVFYLNLRTGHDASPSNQKQDIEPPDQITTEAVYGFLAGAFRFGSVSILAHMILILPHPFKFSPPAAPPAPSSSPTSPPHRPSPFSKDALRARFFHRPLEGFSEWLSPTARVYRPLTPQFKVFLQIAAMTLGGCIWAERRVNDYIDLVRKTKRAERVQAQRAARYGNSLE